MFTDEVTDPVAMSTPSISGIHPFSRKDVFIRAGFGFFVGFAFWKSLDVRRSLKLQLLFRDWFY